MECHSRQNAFRNMSLWTESFTTLTVEISVLPPTQTGKLTTLSGRLGHPSPFPNPPDAFGASLPLTPSIFFLFTDLSTPTTSNSQRWQSVGPTSTTVYNYGSGVSLTDSLRWQCDRADGSDTRRGKSRYFTMYVPQWITTSPCDGG